MIDKQSEHVLAGLYPPFAEKLRQLIGVLGENWRVDEGIRSFAEQDAYFAQGRSRPGGLITRDRAGYSGHCYGTTAHLVPTVKGAVVRDNAAFLQLATEAANVGLEWGGNDATGKFIEMSRVEMVILSMDECLALFKTGQLPAVWAAFDAELGIQPAPPPPVFEISPERDKSTVLAAGDGTLVVPGTDVPEEVAAELAAEVEAEEAVEPRAIATDSPRIVDVGAEPRPLGRAPEVDAKPDSPVVARKKKFEAQKKGK